MLAALLIATALADEPYVSVGVGIPELLHLDIGVELAPGFAGELRGAFTIGGPAVGLGFEGTAMGGTHTQKGHALVAGGAVMTNPTLRPPRLASGGETIATYALVYGGYRFIAQFGLLIRANLGVIAYEDNGFAAGPSGTLAVGWVF
jgi:hypothetical protein